ncbi:MAG: hypothetical protein L0221_05550 [Chloroflexi bacterium]|nr:hypothetical protein [Chloroflexota bacterium]
MSRNRASNRASRRHRPAPAPSWRTWRGALVGVVALGAIGVVGFALVSGGGAQTVDGATAWATLGTRDVHSLAFDPADAQHLYFGHHNGLLESRDGGRTWQATGLGGADAMNVQPGSGPALQIAGHNVYMETADAGRTWAPVPNDLPGLDLHAFAVDPADPAHAWAYAVGFGLFESTDRARHWEQRQPGDWPVLAVTRGSDATALIGLSGSGLGVSADGGRSWQPLATPAGQIASLAAAPDGSALVAGTTRGLYRSTDGGRSWQATGFGGVAITVAVAPTDPRSIAVVDDKTRFFRSDDAGASWPGPP